MTRRSRVFKLRLSPAGMDLLIASHCHLIQATRALLPWGTTLQVAVEYLDSVCVEQVLGLFETDACAVFFGSEEHHLGAAKGVNEVAARIARRASDASANLLKPLISSVYIVALQALRAAGPDDLRQVYLSIRKEI